MSDFASSIKTIAKTAELTEKVDKLLLDSDGVDKGAIESVRKVMFPDASGNTSPSTGGAAGTGGTTGTGPDGTPVLGPIAPPPPQPAPPNTNQPGNYPVGPDKPIGPGGGGDIQNNPTNGPGTSDGSGQGHYGINGGGGSPYTDQGLLGANNPDWLKILDALNARGASQSEINQARIDFLRKELGIDEVGDVYNGDTGAQPVDTSNSNNSRGTDNQGPSAAPPTRQRGILGVDPENNSTALLIRYDGWLPSPSDFDANNGNQDPWVNGLAPIQRTYVAGFYWKIISGATTIYGQTFFDIVGRRESLDGSTAYGCNDGTNKVTTLTPQSGDHILFSGNPNGIIGQSFGSLGGTTYAPQAHLGTVSTGEYGLEACAGGDVGAGATCMLDPPLETAWPVTGIGVLTLTDGKFKKSPYDTEAPFKYSTGQSVAQVKSLVTGETYQTEPAINGGFMISQTSSGGGDYILVYGSNGQLTGLIPTNLKNFYTPRG